MTCKRTEISVVGRSLIRCVRLEQRSTYADTLADRARTGVSGFGNKRQMH